MRSLILLLLLAASLCRAQTKTFYTRHAAGDNKTASISLCSNEVLKVVYAWSSSTSVYQQPVVNVSFDGVETNTITLASTNYPTLAGPAFLEFDCSAYAGIFTVSVEKAPLPPPQQQISSTSVVIPSDTNGPVTILLESSADMITWNAALPGTYGTTTTNRFFRIRAVR